MSISEPFASWLADIVQDDVATGPNCGNDNWRTFSLSHKQARHVSTADIVAFIDAVIQTRDAFVRSHAFPPMLFYVWHDEQASHLCFSVVQKSDGRLPFACQIEVVSSLELIADDFLKDPHHDGIPWSELTDVTHLHKEEISGSQKESEERHPPLKVWVRELPSSDLPAA